MQLRDIPAFHMGRSVAFAGATSMPQGKSLALMTPFACGGAVRVRCGGAMQAAQQREELRVKGDQLDADIQRIGSEVGRHHGMCGQSTKGGNLADNQGLVHNCGLCLVLATC